MDQKFRPGRVRVVYLCISMTKVSAGVLKWLEMVETIPLELYAQGLGSRCRLGSLLLPHAVSGGVGMFKRTSLVPYLLLGLGWMAWSWSGISLSLSLSLPLSCQSLFICQAWVARQSQNSQISYLMADFTQNKHSNRCKLQAFLWPSLRRHRISFASFAFNRLNKPLMPTEILGEEDYY